MIELKARSTTVLYSGSHRKMKFTSIVTLIGLLLSGCTSDVPPVPYVEVDGTVHGGHVKLRELLVSIKEAAGRRVDDKRFDGISYAGHLSTSGRAGYVYGAFVEMNRGLDIGFTIACDAHTIDAADEAIVTETLIGRSVADIEQNVLRFHWRRGKWESDQILGVRTGPKGGLISFDVEYVNAHGSTTGEHLLVVYKIRAVMPAQSTRYETMVVQTIARLMPHLPNEGERFMIEVPKAACFFDEDSKSVDVRDRFIERVKVANP